MDSKSTEDVRTQTVVFITGMTCASCAVTVEKAILSLPGVSGVNVNVASEKHS